MRDHNEIVELTEDVSTSPLYSEDLAPVPPNKRSWGMWDLAAIWVGMAVCIPTYLLASYMIKAGLGWVEALVIIALGNLVITIPMVLNGHAGVKYGVPFPVIGRASFGTTGIHVASIVRGIVACGWFGINTWLGGLAFYAIWHAIMGTEGVGPGDLDAGKFIGFFLFWLMNVYFIWNGEESIKWLEKFAAPILIAIGLLLIAWGAYEAKGFGIVLKQSQQLAAPTAEISKLGDNLFIKLNPIKDKAGKVKASEYRMVVPTLSNGDVESSWRSISNGIDKIPLNGFVPNPNRDAIISGANPVKVQLRVPKNGGFKESSFVNATMAKTEQPGIGSKLLTYLTWLTVMVGFWGTMAISIADITRYTSSQRNQIRGQFIGLPGTMALFSFVGVFVTCAAVINFSDVLVANDAPWDPISLLGRFDNPIVVVVAQIFMIIATLSTNIAANVIAPANAFSNVVPKLLSFRGGGILAAIFGIVICPWLLLDEISGLLIFVSGFLGPVLGILICDYFSVRKKEIALAELYKPKGIYSYGGSGVNMSAMIALGGGILVALIGFLVPAVAFLYNLSWFTGFIASYIIYYLLMKNKV